MAALMVSMQVRDQQKLDAYLRTEFSKGYHSKYPSLHLDFLSTSV